MSFHCQFMSVLQLESINSSYPNWILRLINYFSSPKNTTINIQTKVIHDITKMSKRRSLVKINYQVNKPNGQKLNPNDPP